LQVKSTAPDDIRVESISAKSGPAGLIPTATPAAKNPLAAVTPPGTGIHRLLP